MDDADEIRNLLGRYCHLIDAADFDGIGDLFAHGVLADEHGSVLAGGAGEVSEFLRAGMLLHEGAPRTTHLVVNTVIEVGEAGSAGDGSGREASARSTYVVLQAAPGEALQPIITGRYLDRFGTRDGRWAFAERRYAVDLVGDLSHHLAFEL